jgi:mitochondrial distribution and morphology protein 10
MTTCTQTSLSHPGVRVLLCVSSQLDLLDFATPRGLRSHTASFAAEQFTAAATLSALPILDGSIAYTYTSKPLSGVQGTASSALIDLVQGFREIRPPRAPEDAKDWEIWQAGRRVDFRGHHRR